MALRLLATAVVAACLPGLGQAEERLLIVYPAGSRAVAENNVIEDGWIVAEAKPAKVFKTTEKSVTRTKSSSSVSTSYSVSSSVSSRRADPGERRGRVGRLDRGRMRDLYNRRPPTVARTLVIPPARLMLTRADAGRSLRRSDESAEASESTDRPGALETSRVAGRRSWEVRREEAIGRREERNVARNSLHGNGGRGAVRQNAIPVYTVTRRKYTNVRKKAPVAPRVESVRSVERAENNEITDEKKKPSPAAPAPGWGSREEQRTRLRRILAPKPRHSRGPVPTVTTPEEEAEVEEVGEFLCPPGAGASTKMWRAHPDPVSCRHYYICVAPTEGSQAGPVPVRHGCTHGLVFSRLSETCVPGADCRGGKAKAAKPKLAQQQPAKKQGLFVEFIEFLIRSRLFNERVVKSLLDNKELFQ